MGNEIPRAATTDPTEWGALRQAGKLTFERVCGPCHPGGEPDYGPRLRELGWDAPRVHAQIRGGSNIMKPINDRRVTAADMRGLMVYLSALGTVSGIE